MSNEIRNLYILAPSKELKGFNHIQLMISKLKEIIPWANAIITSELPETVATEDIAIVYLPRINAEDYPEDFIAFVEKNLTADIYVVSRSDKRVAEQNFPEICAALEERRRIEHEENISYLMVKHILERRRSSRGFPRIFPT